MRLGWVSWPSSVVSAPSPALLIALLALFVALGGPAQAARLLSGKDIKNRSLTTRT